MNKLSGIPPLAALCCAAFTVALILWTSCSRAQSGPLEELSAFPKATLTIRGSGVTHQFEIWVADTAAREEQGLMFVRQLQPDQGMVFADAQPRVWAMWMKNTYIELDMLFVAADGRVVKIAAHAKPHDETNISSDVPVKAVIELQGGIAERLHLKVGDLAMWRPTPAAGAEASPASDPQHSSGSHPVR